MAKAKAGRAAKTRRERERRPAKHLETILADIPDHARPEPESVPMGPALQVDSVHADVRSTLRMAGVSASDESVATPEASRAVEQVDVTPDNHPDRARSMINAIIATPDPVRSDALVTTAIAPDDGPTLAPIPRVPADPSAAGATSMDASQNSPRGRMTDRYTVWSRTASRPADTEAPPPDPQPARPVAASADSPDVDVQASGSGDGDQSVSASTHVDTSASTGVDLAMSRLRTATTSTGTTDATDDASTGDDIGSAEAALGDAVDHFIASTGSVEATVSEAAAATGAGLAPQVTDDTEEHPAADPDPADDGHSGAAGLLDDLAGRLGAAGSAIAGSVSQARDATTDDPDAAPVTGHSATQRAGEIVQKGRERATGTVERVRAKANDAAADVKEAASDAVEQVTGAGSDIAGTVTGAATSTRDDVSAAAGQVGARAQAAGEDVAAAVEDGLDRAGDRVGRAAGEITETTQAAAEDVASTVGRAIHDVRDQVTEAAQDLLTIARDAAGDARTIASDVAADARSGITDAAGSIAETGRAAAGAVTGRATEAAQGMAGSASDAASGLATTVRTGLGRSKSSATEPVAVVTQNRTYNRLIVSAVALGTVSGLNRWAVRRLTGADIAILGPSTVHPAILGTGMAALIASLYMTEE